VAANVLCWRLAEGDVTAGHQAHVWIGDIVTRLMQFPFQNHWLLLPKQARNINIHHLMQFKWKID